MKKSKQYVQKKESDFCTHYKGENPAYYNVYVCPQCGYGFTDNFKSPLAEKKESITVAIKPVGDDLCGSRSEEKAILAYQIALRCALLGKERAIIIAGLYLHLAWFNRFRKDQDEEFNNLKKAMEYYEKAIDSDRNLEDPATVFYLIGEISSRTGDDNKAVQYFAHIINDKKINNRTIIRMARERWQEIREAR